MFDVLPSSGQGLHGNHNRYANAYHRTHYQYILIQFIETRYSDNESKYKKINFQASVLFRLSLYSALRLETTSHLIFLLPQHPAPPLDSSQHLQEVHTLYKILFPDAWQSPLLYAKVLINKITHSSR